MEREETQPETPGQEDASTPQAHREDPMSQAYPIDVAVDDPIQTNSESERSAASVSSRDYDGASDDSRPMSPGAHDRVFPIRSVVSVEPTPIFQNEQSDSFPGMSSVPVGRYGDITRKSSDASASSRSTDQLHNSPPYPRERNTSYARTQHYRGRQESMATPAPGPETWQPPMQILSDDASLKSISVHNTGSHRATKSIAFSGKSTESMGGVLTARFTHVVTEEGHAIITGRDGEVLQRCEDEPIHIPGAVQSFGLLIAISEVSDGKLVVKVVSENSKRIIGYSPRQLFGLESFTDILSEEQADNLIDHIEFVKEGEGDTESDGPEVFTISIRHPQTKRSQKLWCAVHVNQRNGELVICEFELEDDIQNPLVPVDDKTPEPPEDTLQSEPTAEEFAESTINASRPLRVLRSARKKKGEAAAMEVFNIMTQIENQLAAATRLDQFLKILVGVVKELTGFHRVMMYQFDHEFNGRVVTELVDPRATKDLYHGLNFPASDIPRQARDLYVLNKVRLLYDRDQETARLVCRSVQDLEVPLDLTHSHLRAMSPIHIKYLGHMAVRSSMSISITAFDELWGLISCHAYGSKGMRVSFPIRKMCRLVGDIASRNIERLSYASRLQARKLINTASTKQNPSGYIVASSDDLLNLFDADCGLLSIHDETKILGKLDNTQEALALLEYFRLRKVSAVLTTQDIRVDFPDLRYAPGFVSIAGVLLVPLSASGADFIAFFRKPQMREVKWAGNPHEKSVREGTEGYLEPRTSFKIWSETVVGKCREWNEEQVETAAVLCLVYGKFIEVWRQKEAAVQNSQLTKLLLANSAHEVRTPLNAIINYLEIALEGTLDQETRDNLSRSHSASKSLIYVINDLLDLTKTEEGNKVIKDDEFDLPETVNEATEPFKGDAKRKQIAYNVRHNPGVPRLVLGDQRRVRQAISNVVANAIQYTTQGSVDVELWLASREGSRVEIDIVVQDTGIGMSAAKLDDIFRTMEQVHVEGETNFPDLLTPESHPATEGKSEIESEAKSGKQPLGYGLALVSRIIRNMNGQLRLKSEEGKGSRFVIQLGFLLPETAQKKPESIKDASGVAAPSTPPVTEGEVMLVSKSASKPKRPSADLVHSRRTSQESIGSARSGKSLGSYKSGSSQRSDVDRLIDAISEPHLLERSGSAKNSNVRAQPSSRTSRPTSLRSRTAEAAVATLGRGESELQPSGAKLPGQADVQDQKTPIRPIRMPSEIQEIGSPTRTAPPRPRASLAPELRPLSRVVTLNADHLSALVAEDDLVNSKIMQKRLQKVGHTVKLTVNGEECATAFGDNCSAFDVVFMDMQMPIADGMTATKMIRSTEKTSSSDQLSMRAKLNRRIPIFAVSATLIEAKRQTYMDAGFDGWILKPVDFKRVAVLLEGIVDPTKRKECLYQPGEWERGGWFELMPDPTPSHTNPDSGEPASSMAPGSSTAGVSPTDSVPREQKRSRGELTADSPRPSTG